MTWFCTNKENSYSSLPETSYLGNLLFGHFKMIEEKQVKNMSHNSVQSMVFCQEGVCHWVGRPRKRCREKAAEVWAVLSSFWVPERLVCMWTSNLTTGTFFCAIISVCGQLVFTLRNPSSSSIQAHEEKMVKNSFVPDYTKIFSRKSTEMEYFWKTQCLKIRLTVLWS